MVDPFTSRKVTAAELRNRFNKAEYWRRAQEGEFTERLMRDRHPHPPRSGDPYCTRSQIMAIFDSQGKKVAIYHRYLRPDGTLGGSGLPDPKHMWEEGIHFYASSA
jgi:hypothetical protein